MAEAESGAAHNGLHRVRIIRPDNDAAASNPMCYRLEVDGNPIYPSQVLVRMDASAGYPVVTLELPAIVENTEILALLQREDHAPADTGQSEDEVPEPDGEGEC